MTKRTPERRIEAIGKFTAIAAALCLVMAFVMSYF